MLERVASHHRAAAKAVAAFALAWIVLPLSGFAQTFVVQHHFKRLPPAGPSGVVRDSAGNLFGTTGGGGNGGYGTVFKLDPSGVLTILHAFGGVPDGVTPVGLLQDGAGTLYGTTYFQSTIFKIDPSGMLTTLFTIGVSGSGGSLIMDGSGSLYGTTNSGGTNDYGSVYKLDAAGVFTFLHSFSFHGPEGFEPNCTLLRDSSGNLYGTTVSGGAGGAGTVFKLDPSGGVTVLHSFSGPDGSGPTAGLIQDTSGNFYGTTDAGGDHNWGTVFMIDSAGTFTSLHSFDGSGYRGVSELMQDSSGNIYGATGGDGAYNNGTVFKLFPFTVVHAFTGQDDGAYPSKVIEDASGNLYGTTYQGGANGLGTVFEIDSAGNFSTLTAFYPSDGANPESALMRDGSGNLFGTTRGGGAKNVGTVFELDPSGTFTTLHSFNRSDGDSPWSSVVQDGAGNLYGTTYLGGSANGGTVFKLDPSGTLTTLHSFTGLAGDGLSPKAALLFDNSGSGSLWGTTTSGGTSGYGEVFKLDGSGTPTGFGLLDASPLGSLVQDAAGNLYGTTSGAPNSFGTVFKIDASGTATTLYGFSGVDGRYPYAGVILDAAGSLYGTTEAGGANYGGTVFELDPSGTLTTLHTFGGADGETPYASLLLGASGNFYGTTYSGGQYGYGTLFMIDPAGTLTTLHSFNGAGGAYPHGALIADGSGNLYGTAEGGGSGGTGVIFTFNAATAPLTVSSISPSSGPALGGTAIDVRGTGFLDGSGLTTGGMAATGFILVDSTEVQGITPPLAPGTLNDVVVANPGNVLGTLAKAWFADFADVPQSSPFHPDVETMFRLGITGGCTVGSYCPDSAVLRQQMAVFLLKAQHGSGYLPPACTGLFDDVPCPGPFTDWIEQLFNEGITGGCGARGYCPGDPVTRAQMAAFLLKAEHGSGYTPPPCSGIFGDVACPSLFADWIEQLSAEGVTGGCQASPLLYCPANANTRGQMAAFLVKTFNLQ